MKKGGVDMRQRGWIAIVCSCSVVATVIACTGKTVEVGGAADGASADSGGQGSDGASGSDSGGGGTDSGLSPDCPASIPAMSSACAKIGLECEYGNDVNLACDTIARCDAKGWTVTAPQGGCPTPAPGPSCPATLATVPEGATCTTPTSCAYSGGTCSCAVYCGPQFPVGHPCDAGTPTTWHCEKAATAACPAERPRVGTSCSPDNAFCQYGDCDALAIKCKDGLWHTQISGCPVSSRRYKQDVHYLNGDELRAVADETLATRLATYEYTIGAPDTRLGFIIEDDPASPAVMKGKDRVDLYGYTSMAVATLQVQSRQIAELRRELDELRREVDAKRAAPSQNPVRGNSRK